MKNTRTIKALACAVFIAFSLFFAPLQSLAAATPGSIPIKEEDCSLDKNGILGKIMLNCETPDTDSILGLIDAVKSFLLGIAGVVAIIAIVINGIRFITSQGNPDNIKGAKSGLTAAIIGLILVILANVIVHLVIVSLNQFLN